MLHSLLVLSCIAQVCTKRDASLDTDLVMLQEHAQAYRTTRATIHRNPPSPQEREAVAVLTSGTSARYLLHYAVNSFIGPMVKEGYRVDYYLALNMQRFDSFSNHADMYEAHPLFNQSLPEVVAAINSSVSSVGGYLQSLRLKDFVELNASDQSDISSSQWYPTAPNRRNRALANWVRKSKLLEALWSDVEKAEESFGRYKTVIIIADDACWAWDFSLANVLSAVALPDDKYVLTLQCGNGSSYPTFDDILCDYVQILGRSAAPMFAKQRSSMQRYSNEHNGEALLRKLALENDLVTPRIPASLIPMQRCGRIGDDALCLHKVCVSDDEDPISTLQKCDSIYS